MYIYIYIYTYVQAHIYIYIHRERERDRQRDPPKVTDMIDNDLVGKVKTAHKQNQKVAE